MERRDPEFAPNTRDAFLEAVGSIACDGECNLNACMQDRHHLIFGEDLSDAEKLLKSHPDFIVHSVCRARHIQTHKKWDRSEPVTTDFVIGYYLASPANMSKTRQKNLNRLRRT